MWDLIAATETGFPWLSVAGKVLTGWIVIDLDATLITAHSNKQGASATFKKGWGFHPLAAWCANTHESPGDAAAHRIAGSNTVADHLRVLTEAISADPRHLPGQDLDPDRRRGRHPRPGRTHEGLNTTRRTVRFTVGWKITETDETRDRQAARRRLAGRRAPGRRGPRRTRTSPS